MNIKTLNEKVGKCDYQLAFAMPNGSLRRVEGVYISDQRKLVVLKAPRTAFKEDDND